MLGRVRKGQVWCALLGLSLSLSFTTAVLERGPSNGSEPFRLQDRTLGPDLAEGFEAPLEELSAGWFSILLATSSVALFLALSLFNGWLDSRLDSAAGAGEKSGLLLLSQISLGLYGMHLIVGGAAPESMRGGLHLLAGLLLMSMAAKRLVAGLLSRNREWAFVWAMLSDNQLMLAGLFFPIAMISLCDGVLRGVIQPLGFLSSGRGFVDYLVVLLFLVAAYSLVLWRSAAMKRAGLASTLYDLNTAVIVAGAPWVLIPLALQIANEVQYTLNGINAQWLSWICVGILIGSSLLLFWMQRRGVIRLAGTRVLEGFYFPVAVATLASFRFHRHTLLLEQLDYFSSGERVLPAQQWADFGSIPLLDLIPVQGLSDAGVQSLYTLFNGVQGLDMLVWLPWIPLVVGFLLIYSLLALVASPLLAFLVTILLPVKSVVVGQYALALLPAALLVVALRRPGFSRFLALWVGAGLLILWRPFLGWPALIAALIVVSVVVLLENRDRLGPAASALAVVIGALPIGLVVTEIFGRGDTLETLRALTCWAGGPGGRGLGAISTTAGSVGLAHFLEQLLPVVSVVSLLFYGIRKMVAGATFSASSYGVLYLVVFSLLMPARLETGEGAELFDPSLLLLMLALMPFLVFRGSFRTWMSGRSSWLILTLVACALIGRVDVYNLMGENVVHRVREWRPGEQRVLFDQGPHADLIEVLRRELKEGETFLDFTNSPLIYSLAGKRFPFQKISDYRSTSESRQQSQIAVLEEYGEEQGLPLVLFQAPAELSVADHQLPVAATSYRIAEYIYGHYLPFASVSGWEVWRQSGVRRDNPEPPARILNPSAVTQQFWLGSLPYLWAKGDPWQAGFQTDLIEALLTTPSVVRSGASLPLEWETMVAAEEGNYLQIRARSLSALAVGASGSAGATLTVDYGDTVASSFEFTLAPWTYQERGDEEELKLPVREFPKIHSLEESSAGTAHLVYKTNGPDPWIRRFVDTSMARSLDPGEELWLSLDYRSSRSGQGQVFFTANERHFRRPGSSVTVPLMATGQGAEAQRIVVPVVGIEPGEKLRDVRFDPPDGTEFEIVGVDLIRRRREFDDYLVRLSTQWRWFSGGIQQVTLRSDSPILVDSVNLRTAD